MFVYPIFKFSLLVALSTVKVVGAIIGLFALVPPIVANTNVSFGNKTRYSFPPPAGLTMWIAHTQSSKIKNNRHNQVVQSMTYFAISELFLSRIQWRFWECKSPTTCNNYTILHCCLTLKSVYNDSTLYLLRVLQNKYNLLLSYSILQV